MASLAFSALKMWLSGHLIKIAGRNVTTAKFSVLIVNGEHVHPYLDSADRLVAALANASYLNIFGEDHLSAVLDDRFKKAAMDFLTPVVSY